MEHMLETLPESPRPAPPRIRNLDHLGMRNLCETLTVFTPTAEQIAYLVERARQDMPILAPIEVIQKVAAANPDCFWALRRTPPNAQQQPARPSGFVAFLMLNAEGREALLAGDLNPAAPLPRLLSGQHQKPAAIYVWALHAKGCLTPALALVMDKLQSPNYRAADFIARAATAEGASFLAALGFVTREAAGGRVFHHFTRQVSPPAPHLQIGPPASREALVAKRSAATRGMANQPPLIIKTVHSFDELMQVIAVRSSVYVGEERCPFQEEFDGNDFSATQILGKAGTEPAGCLRIRYFARFAKFERLAVRQEYRGLGLARELIAYGKELCRLKGYGTLYAHARADKVDFWTKFGFTRSQPGASFIFSDYEYVEMEAHFPPHPSPITLGIDPYIFLRPEGQWDTPGLLENSALRAVAS